MKIGRRGQEEIVGFVLIIVIVAVIFLVFLGISLRQETSSVSNEIDVYQFLESSMEFTTECSKRFEGDFLVLGELFEECYSESRCLNGIEACEVLNENLDKILDASWNVGEESVIKGYKFQSVYLADTDSSREEIVNREKGICGESLRGSSYISPAFPGRIKSILEICY
jgi:hypothetical protein